MKQDAVIKIFKTGAIFFVYDNIAFVVCRNNENDYKINHIEENESKAHTGLTHFPSKNHLLLSTFI